MTTLTDLQRWARERGTPLAPQALRTLKAEGFLEAEAVATLPSSELRKLPYVKEASIDALRAWQAEQGIPVPPDPEVDVGEAVRRLYEPTPNFLKPFIGPDGPIIPVGWAPRSEKELVAWETYLELLKPSPVMGERVNVAEAMKQAWLAADAWESQRKQRETKGESDGNESHSDAG